MEDSVYIRGTRQRLFALEHEFEKVGVRHSRRYDTKPRSHIRVLSDSLAEILRDGKPMHRMEILARLQAMYIHLSPTNPIGHMIAGLSRDDRFTSDGRGNWRMAEPPGQDEG